MSTLRRAPDGRPSPGRAGPGGARPFRALLTGAASLAIVASVMAAPATARPAPVLAQPVSFPTRGGAGLANVAAERVQAKTAAANARANPRASRVLERRPVDLGARVGAGRRAGGAKSRTVDWTGSSASGASITPRVVGGTTEQQVATSFPGIEQADTCECEPPDPWIAVSPSHVVQSTNGKIRVSSRTGVEILSMPTWALFAVPADRFDADPRIIWDAVHTRWVGVITTFNGDFSVNGLRLAVSETADPTGGWVVYPIETGEFLADFPGLSSASDKVILSSDDFHDIDPLPDSADFVFDGPTLYAIDWSTILTATALTGGVYIDGPDRAHFRPAQMLTSGSRVPVVFESVGGDVMYAEVSGSAGALNGIAPGEIPYVDLTTTVGLDAAQFIAPASQPTQPGADEISGAVDERPTDAVYRSGHLWFVATTDFFDGVDHWSAGRWTDVATPLNGSVPTDVTDWLPNVSQHVFSGGIGVSGNGTAWLTATITDDTTFPTTIVATILPGGVSQGFIPIEASTEAYVGDRWGDYVGVAADPSGSGSVWLEHELVAAGGGWRTGVVRLVSDAAAPSASGAVSQVSVTSATLTSSVAVKTSWLAATDAGSGVARYLVERSDGGGPFFGVTTTGTSITQPLIVGQLYQYRITAIDAAGNAGPVRLGPAYRPTVYQSNTAATVYTTGWGTSTSSAYSGGSTKYSSTAGKYATFTATNARSIAIVATKAASRGSFKVYVDGVYKATVSTYSATTRFRQLVYQFAWSAPGTHKVKVAIVGTSGHPRVDLDAFVVLR
jgi:hypothetical protein